MWKMLFLVLTIVLSFNAQAGVQTSDSNGTTVTLHEPICTTPAVLAELPRLNQLLAQVGKPPVVQLRNADLIYEGKSYKACWAVVDSMVVVVDDGGQPDSIFTVPIQAFRDVEGI